VVFYLSIATLAVYIFSKTNPHEFFGIQIMKKSLLIIALSYILFFFQNSWAANQSIPLQIDYPFIKKTLVTQLFKGPNQTAELWNDRRGCSYLKLSNPSLDGQKGLVHMINQVQARFGTALDGQCITLLEWVGALETFQKPELQADNSILRFPVTKINAYDTNGKQLTIDKLQDLIKRFAEPKLADLKIDLNEARAATTKSLADFLPQNKVAEVQELLKSVKFEQVTAGDKAINVALAFNPPQQPTNNAPSAAFTDSELKQWQEIQLEWDSFLGKAIDQADIDKTSATFKDSLTEVLLDSHSAFQAALTSKANNDNDPVRAFFSRTWDRLSPELKTVSKDIPGLEKLRYASLIAGTDVIYELEKFTTPFGLDITSDGLRRLARMLITAKQQRSNPQPQ
jgi:hypothetical protein